MSIVVLDPGHYVGECNRCGRRTGSEYTCNRTVRIALKLLGWVPGTDEAARGDIHVCTECQEELLGETLEPE